LFEVFDVGFVAYEESDEKFDWLGMMRGKGKMWDEIVEKYELLELRWRILLVSKHLMCF
jgi:hypothetical protein